MYSLFYILDTKRTSMKFYHDLITLILVVTFVLLLVVLSVYCRHMLYWLQDETKRVDPHYSQNLYL